MTEPETPHERRPFESFPEPEPFYRTIEFQRFIRIAGVALVLILGLLYVQFRGSSKHAPAVADTAPAPPPLLGPADQALREQRLTTLFEGSLNDTKNGDGFVETTGYRRLLQILMSYSPEAVSSRATRKLDYKAALADPDAWRGEFVWTRGLVADIYADRLQNPVFGVRDRFQGILTEADGTEGILFDLCDPPPPIAKRDEAVDIEGIFYRTIRYEAAQAGKGQDQYRLIPYLLVKNVRPVRNASASPGGFMKDNAALLLVGMALAFIAARLLTYWLHRRRRPAPVTPKPAPGFREMFDKKIRQDPTQGPRPSS